MQPRLISRIIAPTVDRLFENVGVIATQTRDFLSQAILKAGHQIIMAAIPQRTTTCQIAFHTDAVGFDDVLAVGLGVERWQLTVPIDDLGLLARCAHTNDTSRLRAGLRSSVRSAVPADAGRRSAPVAEARVVAASALDGEVKAETAQAAQAWAGVSSVRAVGSAAWSLSTSGQSTFAPAREPPALVARIDLV